MTRRATGMALVIVAIGAIAYALFGRYIPGFAGHKGYSFARVISVIFSEQGILGSPIHMSATYALLFVLLGSFLSVCGAAEFFNELAKSLCGGLRGGPAKTAVVASGLFGMISGHSAANVATTGTFTIPLMKETGYSPEFSGAVEAASSAGGQFMPPVMGSVVFMMMALTGLPYAEIVKTAALPAILYFTCIYLMVDYEAANRGLYGLPKSVLPKLWPTLRSGGHLLAPVVWLVYMLLFRKATIIMACLTSILVVIGASYIGKGKPMTPKRFVDAIYGGSNVIRIAAATATAGIMIGIITLTGVGVKIGGILLSITGGSLFLTLVLSATLCILLGMGMSAIASYVVTAAVMAPALIQLGLSTMVTHLFILIYACLSTITPPVAISAYTAAGIAGADPLKTAGNSVKLGVTGFLVPFMMVYSPTLALTGTWWRILTAFITAFLGVFALSRGIGYMRVPLPARLILIGGGLLLFHGRINTDLPGLALIALAIYLEKVLSKKQYGKEDKNVCQTSASNGQPEGP